MPTLDWIGKDKVINHHLDVPYRVLERVYSYDQTGQHDADNGSENMIIHGDNLEALKALLPQYEGRVKCIYIDPPYNTATSTNSNRKWVYSDNVDSPIISAWIGKTVGDEGEDLTRHDKWLCMMYPRLKLLQKLLSDDGVIFISISDVEHASLKMICNEIFGMNCFVANVIWENNYSPRNDSKGIAYTTDNILVYSKNPGWTPQRLARSEIMDARYNAPDNDPVPWTSSPAHAPSARSHKGMVYGIQHPFTGKIFYPPAGRCWALEQEKILSNMREWASYKLENLDDSSIRAEICGEDDIASMPNIKAIVLDESIETAKEKVINRINQGTWPPFYFTNNGKGGLRVKKHLEDMGGKVVTTLWAYEDVGTNTEAKNDIKKIFDGNVPFETPKPCRLIERILRVVGSENMVVLDSFSGSGTTAHSVLSLNSMDGGHRRFILIEMEHYADTITAERVKRVIDGYGEGKSAVPGIPGDFSFYELGEPLFIGANLNEDVGIDKIREYVFFTETRQRIQPSGETYYLGSHVGNAYYFYYERDRTTTLDRVFLDTIDIPATHYVIYADLCTLTEEELNALNITFKKIPRDITRL